MALTQVDQGLLGTNAQYTGFKNRIINGAMVIDQRNAGASITPTSGQYSVDRWNFYLTQASKFTAQQSSTAAIGFVNSLKVTSSSAYSVVASDYFFLDQSIEGYNVSDLGWGTANAKTVTLSFWVQSSLTGTFGGCVGTYNAGRSYPFTYTISAANTWEQKSVTIAGDTSGTWPTTNAGSIALYFGLGAGSTYSGTAGSWSGGNYYSATGAVSVVGTSGATFYITGVQLEKGSTATSFDYRPFGTELMLCQRYYQKSFNQSVSSGTAAYLGGLHTVSWGDGNAAGFVWQVSMRADPTVTLYPTASTLSGYVNSGGTDRVASATYPSERGVSFIAVTSGSANNFTRFQYTASAEL